MAQRILTSSQPAAAQLDALIKQMESTLGKAHTQSPFTGVYSQYGFSTGPVVEEEKKEQPQIAEEKKDDTKNEAKKVQAEKKPKAPKEATQKQNPPKKGTPAAPQSDLSEELQAYLACDLRVGKIVECSKHPESAKLYVEKIDLGEG